MIWHSDNDTCYNAISSTWRVTTAACGSLVSPGDTEGKLRDNTAASSVTESVILKTESRHNKRVVSTVRNVKHPLTFDRLRVGLFSSRHRWCDRQDVSLHHYSTLCLFSVFVGCYNNMQKQKVRMRTDPTRPWFFCCAVTFLGSRCKFISVSHAARGGSIDWASTLNTRKKVEEEEKEKSLLPSSTPLKRLGNHSAVLVLPYFFQSSLVHTVWTKQKASGSRPHSTL